MGCLVYGVVRGFECGLECDFYGSGCAQESCVSIGLFQVVLPFCAYRRGLGVSVFAAGPRVFVN